MGFFESGLETTCSSSQQLAKEGGKWRDGINTFTLRPPYFQATRQWFPIIFMSHWVSTRHTMCSSNPGLLPWLGGGWWDLSPKNIFMLSRSAASTAQPEPPLPIDAPTTLKKDIPACLKHPAGSIWVLKNFVIFMRIPKQQPFLCSVGGNSLASRSEGGAWCPGWEEVGSVSRGFYQLRVLVPFKKSKSTSIAKYQYWK